MKMTAENTIIVLGGLYTKYPGWPSLIPLRKVMRASHELPLTVRP